jgi:hypothetical protein
MPPVLAFDAAGIVTITSAHRLDESDRHALTAVRIKTANALKKEIFFLT